MRHTSAILILLVAAILCGMFSCQGCKDDIPEPCNDPGNPQCPNYDPCHGRKTPVSAAFDVRGVLIGGGTRLIPEDTIIAGSRLLFVALDSTPGTTYEWEVGSPLNTSRNISYWLDFRCEDVSRQTIPVRLIASRLADSTCLSASELRDTFIRNLYFFPMREASFFGRWKGALDSAPNEIYTLELGYEDVNPNEEPCNLWRGATVKNVRNDGACIRIFFRADVSYRKAWLSDSPILFASDGCNPPPGYVGTGLTDFNLVITQSDSIEIKFNYHSSPSSGLDRIEKLVFRGRRVP